MNQSNYKKVILTVSALILGVCTTQATFAKGDPNKALVQQKALKIIRSNHTGDYNVFDVNVKHFRGSEWSILYSYSPTGELMGCEIRVKVQGNKVIQTSNAMCE